MAGEGVSFQVVDVDTFSHNEVVGRCFRSAKEMQQAMKSNKPIVMSLGARGARSVPYIQPHRTNALRFASTIDPCARSC